MKKNELKSKHIDHIIKRLKIIRITKALTFLFGPLNRPNNKRIEIILNFNCNLHCFDCSIMCRQAQSNEYMSVEQIERFINQSIIQKKKWEIIRIIGGEPTLNPNLKKISNLLISYKNEYLPQVPIEIVSNGYSPDSHTILSQIPKGVKLRVSNKQSQYQRYHRAINYAPIDDGLYKFSDFSNCCRVTVSQGFGLSPYGYYYCNVAAAIDKVLGFDIGRKELPAENDFMLDMAPKICQYCGHFRMFDRYHKGYTSKFWQTALLNYNKNKPILTEF